jgi:hypothetical protein
MGGLTMPIYRVTMHGLGGRGGLCLFVRAPAGGKRALLSWARRRHGTAGGPYEAEPVTPAELADKLRYGTAVFDLGDGGARQGELDVLNPAEAYRYAELPLPERFRTYIPTYAPEVL